jgi:hypothetical protein
MERLILKRELRNTELINLVNSSGRRRTQLEMKMFVNVTHSGVI